MFRPGHFELVGHIFLFPLRGLRSYWDSYEGERVMLTGAGIEKD